MPVPLLKTRAVLLSDELRSQLPWLYAQEKKRDPTVICRFFTPDSHWTWFITEGQPEEDDFIFFGYVIGFAEEWGYSSLNELQAARGPLGLPIERDLCFKPSPFSEVLRRFRG